MSSLSIKNYIILTFVHDENLPKNRDNIVYFTESPNTPSFCPTLKHEFDEIIKADGHDEDTHIVYLEWRIESSNGNLFKVFEKHCSRETYLISKQLYHWIYLSDSSTWMLVWAAMPDHLPQNFCEQPFYIQFKNIINSMQVCWEKHRENEKKEKRESLND